MPLSKLFLCAVKPSSCVLWALVYVFGLSITFTKTSAVSYKEKQYTTNACV